MLQQANQAASRACRQSGMLCVFQAAPMVASVPKLTVGPQLDAWANRPRIPWNILQCPPGERTKHRKQNTARRARCSRHQWEGSIGRAAGEARTSKSSSSRANSLSNESSAACAALNVTAGGCAFCSLAAAGALDSGMWACDAIGFDPQLAPPLSSDLAAAIVDVAPRARTCAGAGAGAPLADSSDSAGSPISTSPSRSDTEMSES